MTWWKIRLIDFNILIWNAVSFSNYKTYLEFVLNPLMVGILFTCH